MDKTIIQKDTCIPMFIATLFKRAKKHRNNLNVHQVNKEDVAHIRNRTLLSHEKQCHVQRHEHN